MELQEFKTTLVPLRDKLHNVARRILPSEADAEDAVQETYLRLWSVRAQLDDHPNVGGFAMQTIKNICIDKIRRSRANVSADNIANTEDNRTPYSYTEEKDNYSIAKKIIESLPELQRRIITMRDIEGYELKEIADITGSEVSAVTMNLSRARKKVRESFLKLNKLSETS